MGYISDQSKKTLSNELKLLFDNFKPVFEIFAPDLVQKYATNVASVTDEDIHDFQLHLAAFVAVTDFIKHFTRLMAELAASVSGSSKKSIRYSVALMMLVLGVVQLMIAAIAYSGAGGKMDKATPVLVAVLATLNNVLSNNVIVEKSESSQPLMENKEASKYLVLANKPLGTMLLQLHFPAAIVPLLCVATPSFSNVFLQQHAYQIANGIITFGTAANLIMPISAAMAKLTPRSVQLIQLATLVGVPGICLTVATSVGGHATSQMVKNVSPLIAVVLATLVSVIAAQLNQETAAAVDSNPSNALPYIDGINKSLTVLGDFAAHMRSSVYASHFSLQASNPVLAKLFRNVLQTDVAYDGAGAFLAIAASDPINRNQTKLHKQSFYFFAGGAFGLATSMVDSLGLGRPVMGIGADVCFFMVKITIVLKQYEIHEKQQGNTTSPSYLTYLDPRREVLPPYNPECFTEIQASAPGMDV